MSQQHKPTANTTATMGLAYNVYLNSSRIYGCKSCKTHLSNHEDIISRVRLFLSITKQPSTNINP